ncbi:hypothetical protein [Streptomyces sp. NPDC047028]|uniref:hypothetical protein n=1 Tax=Streptomyces sp. NPDC047028 TaxID=3155793 RepID=UPI0033FC9F41
MSSPSEIAAIVSDAVGVALGGSAPPKSLLESMPERKSSVVSERKYPAQQTPAAIEVSDENLRVLNDTNNQILSTVPEGGRVAFDIRPVLLGGTRNNVIVLKKIPAWMQRGGPFVRAGEIVVLKHGKKFDPFGSEPGSVAVTSAWAQEDIESLLKTFTKKKLARFEPAKELDRGVLATLNKERAETLTLLRAVEQGIQTKVDQANQLLQQIIEVERLEVFAVGFQASLRVRDLSSNVEALEARLNRLAEAEHDLADEHSSPELCKKVMDNLKRSQLPAIDESSRNVGKLFDSMVFIIDRNVLESYAYDSSENVEKIKKAHDKFNRVAAGASAMAATALLDTVRRAGMTLEQTAMMAAKYHEITKAVTEIKSSKTMQQVRVAHGEDPLLLYRAMVAQQKDKLELLVKTVGTVLAGSLIQFPGIGGLASSVYDGVTDTITGVVGAYTEARIAQAEANIKKAEEEVRARKAELKTTRPGGVVIPDVYGAKDLPAGLRQSMLDGIDKGLRKVQETAKGLTSKQIASISGFVASTVIPKVLKLVLEYFPPEPAPTFDEARLLGLVRNIVTSVTPKDIAAPEEIGSPEEKKSAPPGMPLDTIAENPDLAAGWRGYRFTWVAPVGPAFDGEAADRCYTVRFDYREGSSVVAEFYPAGQTPADQLHVRSLSPGTYTAWDRLKVQRDGISHRGYSGGDTAQQAGAWHTCRVGDFDQILFLPEGQVTGHLWGHKRDKPFGAAAGSGETLLSYIEDRLTPFPGGIHALLLDEGAGRPPLSLTADSA